MRLLFGASITLFIIVIATGMAKATPRVESSFIDIDKDCVVVSSATENAPIDFFESECRSFGGYQLSIKGSDLRYSPRLSYLGREIELLRPMSFHDMNDSQIEWIYSLEVDEEGSGQIEWRGLIYQLSVADNDEEDENSIGDRPVYYAVRLQGEQTCVIGTVVSAEEARVLIADPATPCLEQ
ncbi:hypothetical protein [Bdellovibrio sp. HCB2-146]|uniref:hypothetical protein n=1 Tax=Bdellovibrio sp. HCB2-146 TaxID=3394362 RepID=UPI0039BD5239